MADDESDDALLNSTAIPAARLHAAIAGPLTDWLEEQEARGDSIPTTILAFLHVFGASMACVHLDCGGGEDRAHLEAVFDLHARMLKHSFIGAVEALVAQDEAEEAIEHGRKPS